MFSMEDECVQHFAAYGHMMRAVYFRLLSNVDETPI